MKLSVLRFIISLKYLLLAFFLFACSGAQEANNPVIQPKKEATWVRTEKVRTTKDEAVYGKEKTLEKIPINSDLAKKLATKRLNQIVVTDKTSCLNRLEPLDLRRTAIQKAGGMFRAFERTNGLKHYSFNGIQIDSNTNKMVFGLRYLCQTSQGVPLNELAIELSKLIKVHGREKTGKILIARGRPLEEVETLLNYEEFALKASKRKIDFEIIGPRFDQAEILIDLYDDLSKRKIDKISANKFLSDSVTLLKVLREFIETDQVMAMVLNEDILVPFHKKNQGM